MVSEELSRIFHQLGDPIWSEGKKAELNRLMDNPDHDTFYFLLDLRYRKILRHSNVMSILGYSTFSHELWMESIHEDYLKFYLEFGYIAYKLSRKYADEIRRYEAYYSIQIPVKKANGESIWVMQHSKPLLFDSNGQMVVHFNTYRVLDPFNGEPRKLKPFVKFGRNPKFDIEEEIIKRSRYQIIKYLMRDMPLHLRKVVCAYWALYQQNNRKQKTSNQDVAKFLELTQNSVRHYNKEIKRIANASFMVSKFTEASQFAVFLYELFGELDDNLQELLCSVQATY